MLPLKAIQRLRTVRLSSGKTFNVQVRFHVAREKNEEGTIVEGNVQSVGGYSGPATFSFTLNGDHIQRLVIE
jgi:hypothetical protein